MSAPGSKPPRARTIRPNPFNCPGCKRSLTFDEVCDLSSVNRPLTVLDDVQLHDLAGPGWLVSDRLPTGGLVLLYGPPAVGKTFVAIDLACRMALGGMWLGADVVTPVPTMYVAAENVAVLRQRVIGWKQQHGIPLEALMGIYTVIHHVNMLDPFHVADLADWVQKVGARLVLLDTLAKCLPGADENSARDVGLFVANCDLLQRQTGATVLVVHHTGKNLDRERGSSALRAAADTVIAIRAGDGQIEVSCEKQRQAVEFNRIQIRLIPTPDTATCVVELATAKLVDDGVLSEKQRYLLRVLTDNFLPDEGATATAWLRSAKPIPERTFYQAKKSLVERGLVEQRQHRFFVVRRS